MKKNRKTFIYVLISFLSLLTSCQKEIILPTAPLPPQPIITDTIIGATGMSLANEIWVIDKIGINSQFNTSTIDDTLFFIDNKHYVNSNDTSTYNLYETGSSYTLTLNGTLWGSLSGSIYDGNLTNGNISGLLFRNIIFGGDNSTKYYIWMRRI